MNDASHWDWERMLKPWPRNTPWLRSRTKRMTKPDDISLRDWKAVNGDAAEPDTAPYHAAIFAVRAKMAEREACAQVAENAGYPGLADAIRGRGAEGGLASVDRYEGMSCTMPRYVYITTPNSEDVK